MYSDTPKILHRILGRPLITFVVMNSRKTGAEEIIVVTGSDSSAVKKELGDEVRYAVQPVPRGTGDAARCGLERARHDRVLILCADVPLLSADTVLQMIHGHDAASSDLTVLTCHLDDPSGYGRVIRDTRGGITGIVEQTDATDAQASIKEINAGVYFGAKDDMLAALEDVAAGNNQGELYLTDIIAIMLKAGRSVAAHKISDADEIMGINSKSQLARARDLVKQRWLAQLMDKGVYIEDPATTSIDLSVRIGSDVHIRPFVIIEGETTIPDKTVVGPHAWIKDGKKQHIPGAG